MQKQPVNKDCLDCVETESISYNKAKAVEYAMKYGVDPNTEGFM